MDGRRSKRDQAIVICVIVSSFLAIRFSSAQDHDPPLRVARARLADALSCPSRFTSRREPVLLVHGTSVTADENWRWNYEKALPPAGFDVCTVLMPDRALGDMQISSEYVVYAIRTIAAATKKKVEVIGISQGGLEPRWALKWWPGLRRVVDDYIGMASLNHGVTYADANCSAGSCLPALWQARQGSHFMAALNSRDETPGPVSYTSIYSLTDEVIQPFTTVPLKGGVSVAVQDVCPGRYVGHVQSAWDNVYYALVMDALEHPGPADPSRIDRDACLHTIMPKADPEEAAIRTGEVYVYAGIVQTQHAKTNHEPPLASYTAKG